jgi:maltose alpha-D-glucosyltransferase/alpha-amylase
METAREALFAKLETLAEMVEGATLTRIHGDMHLGQVLVCNGDVLIIDFEGEPAKPIELRRGKDHPLRDAAGMIRSFDYAAAVVKRRSQASHAHLADEQVNAFLDTFVQQATRAFLSGYREAVAPGGEPTPTALGEELLDLFLIEKAAYEVVYEAANRPTWIDVPLHGLAHCTRQLLGIEAVA